MRLIIQHEDMSAPLMVKENADHIPNVGDFVTIVAKADSPLAEECNGIYEVTIKHFFYDDNTSEGDGVLVWVKGDIPTQPPMDDAELEKHKEQWLQYKNRK